METAIKTSHAVNQITFNTNANTSALPKSGLMAWYHRTMKDLEYSHFAVIAMAILIGSCLGSIAAMYVFLGGGPIWMFSIGLFASLANLVVSIAQAPTKWVVWTFLLSVVINASLVIMYAIG